MSLYENYKDDILNTSVNEKRKYRMINNGDGTVSFEDVTSYTQNGDLFGAEDVNAITRKINELSLNLNNFKLKIIEAAIDQYVDKSELKLDYYIGTSWNGAYVFAQLNEENTNCILSAGNGVTNGSIPLSAFSKDGDFSSGDSIDVTILLLLDTSVVG